MHDLREIRTNPQAFDAAMARRGLSPQTPAILALDEKRRSLQTEIQQMLQVRNEKSKLIGQLKAKKENADALMAEVASLKDKTTALEEEERKIAEDLTALLSTIPNVQAKDIPDGKDEEANKELRKVGTPKKTGAGHMDHVAIGEALGMLDFDTAVKISGSRFVIMHSGLAQLERALAQFMLDTHTRDHGYTEVSPPLMVNDATMYGTGQLPKFRDDQFQTTRGDWLIPTSEVPLTNIVADSIVDYGSLPRRYTAHTPCFRQEAGAAGKDTKGMIRQHQFYKVEMVSITKPDESEAEHERMTKCAETILEKLGLPFRTIVLCTGDAGFASYKTYDIEVWLPGQDRYREISSCSNCWDFQARRMKARTKKPGEKDTSFVHTLNGSGVAVGRALIAVLENYWDGDSKTVTIPEVLRPYMGGADKISAKS